MKHKSKYEKEREGANQVAEIMYGALLKLPKEEQKEAVQDIQKIKITA